MDPTYDASAAVDDIVSPLSGSLPVIFGAVGGVIGAVVLIWFVIKQARKGAKTA